MTWTAPRRSTEARAIYEAAEQDRRAHPERYDLGSDVVDAVVDRATRGAGPSVLDTPVGDWREGLVAYLGSAGEDGRLNAVGARMVLGTAVGKLRARVAMVGQPDLPLPEAPIVIIGGWRTGTTFLFRLLATDPRLRAPLPAELTTPWKLAGLTGEERQARLDAASSAHDGLHLLNPGLAAVHDSGAHLPEECVLAMGTDFRNWGFSSTVRLESYSEWLADQDMAGSYARYRQVLGILDGHDGRRWLLKAPAHTAELPNLVRAFPGAVVVHLHRDPVETVASGASLFATFRSTYSDAVDPADVGRFQVDQTERWLRRAMAFRGRSEAAGATVVDVDYSDLVADPAAVATRIWTAADLDPLPDPAGFVDRYDVDHPRHGKGVHRYAPEDFGLDPGEIRERFAFSRAGS